MRGRTGPGHAPGFTRGETGAIILLAAGLLAGSLLRLAGVTGGALPDAAPQFDYTAADSAFRALTDTTTPGAPQASPGAQQAPTGAHPPAAPRRKPPPPRTPIDINSASHAELLLLPGVGDATASRIIDERTQGGPFARVDDLCRVRGIGPRRLAALRPYVTVR